MVLVVMLIVHCDVTPLVVRRNLLGYVRSTRGLLEFVDIAILPLLSSLC